MTAINKIITVFFFAIWSAYVSAADSSIRKVNKFGKIQMNKVGQNLQEMEIAVCDDKSLALLLCGTDVGMTSCYECASQLSIPLFNTCSWSSEVESFCNAGGSCMNAFRQDCKDELQTVLTCLLSPCDADTCSHVAGGNNGTVIASAGAVVRIIIWCRSRDLFLSQKGIERLSSPDT
jgi:hypothetical protein